MINVIASIQVIEGKLSKFIEIFKSNVPKVIEEKGCIEYVPTVDVPTGLPPQELMFQYTKRNTKTYTSRNIRTV